MDRLLSNKPLDDSVTATLKWVVGNRSTVASPADNQNKYAGSTLTNLTSGQPRASHHQSPPGQLQSNKQTSSGHQHISGEFDAPRASNSMKNRNSGQQSQSGSGSYRNSPNMSSTKNGVEKSSSPGNNSPHDGLIEK